MGNLRGQGNKKPFQIIREADTTLLHYSLLLITSKNPECGFK